MNYKNQQSTMTNQHKNNTALDEKFGVIKTGFLCIDKLIEGFHRSDLIILAARPSVGKTTLSMQFAVNVTGQKKTVLVFSIEQSAVMLQNLIVRQLSGELHSFGNISSATNRKERLKIIQNLPVSIHDQPLDLGQIYNYTKLCHKQAPLGLVIVDFLQLIQLDNRDIRNTLGDITRQLQTLAREINTPILALSQLSSELETRSDKRPVITDLKDFDSVERNVDLISFLFRDYTYHPDNNKYFDIAELNISKNRNGHTGKVELIFQKETCSFECLPTINKSLDV